DRARAVDLRPPPRALHPPPPRRARRGAAGHGQEHALLPPCLLPLPADDADHGLPGPPRGRPADAHRARPRPLREAPRGPRVKLPVADRSVAMGDTPKPPGPHRGVKVFADYDSAIHTSCEVLVVGSGPGGAVVAKELAEAGKDVILVEEGPPFSPSDFRQE